MKKGFKKLLALVLTVFTLALAGVLYGCGDPYKNVKISILTEAPIELSIDSMGNATSKTVSVKVSGMPDGSSNALILRKIDKEDVATIDEESVDYNESTGITTFKVIANKGGEAQLVVRAEGGKEATASIIVEEHLRNFSFKDSYKPTIFVGKSFSVDAFGLRFENESATNKNVDVVLFQETANGAVRVATLTNGILTSTQTQSLSTTANYYLRATTVDGNISATTKVVVVNEIDVNDIEIYQTGTTNGQPVETITLATNIDSLTSKTFNIDVKNRTDLKYEVTTNEAELICKVAQDKADPSIFTVTKQNRGISTITIRVGYKDSFDYYSVTKTYAVEVYSEPKNIVIKGLSVGENGAEELNVFASGNEWQLVDLSIDPYETNYKDVKISILSDNYNKHYFKFGVQNTTGAIDEIVLKNPSNNNEDGKPVFVQEGDYIVATYNSVYKLYVSVTNQTAAENNENFNIAFTSERNPQATRTVKFYAREQISGFTLTNGTISDVDVNNDGNLVDVIFAPVGSAVTKVEFSYNTGYGDITLDYNNNRIEASEVVIDRATKTGYFTIRGLVEKSVNKLAIYNGEIRQAYIDVVSATAASANAQVSVNTNNSTAILTDKTAYRSQEGYDRYIAFNNEAGAAPVEITLSFSDENASILNYSVTTERVDADDTNTISYVNNQLLISNKSAEAKTYLTFRLMYFVLNSGELNSYSVRQFDYKILISYSPELAEDMIAFAYYNNDKAITYAELVDYTAAGDKADEKSILDLELFIAGDSTGSFFTIKSVDLVLPTSGAKYLTVKQGLEASESGRYRFQILAGNLQTEQETFNLTFNVVQDGRTKTIQKQFYIVVNKPSIVTSIELDESVNVSAGGNGTDGAVYNVMQLGETGETENVVIVNSYNKTEKVSYNYLEVNSVAVNPNDYSQELTNAVLPIAFNNGVVTRVSEGAAKISIKLINTATLNRNTWEATGEIEYIYSDYNSIEFIVRCYGDSVAKDIYNASDFATISSAGKYTLANNIDLTGVSFNIARFNADSELNGNGYIIYGLNQTTALFNENYGTIKNFNLIINQTIVSGASKLGAICVTNYGTIENVEVNVNVNVATEKDFVYGAVAAENNANITILNGEVNVNFKNTNAGVIGAVCGINNGFINGVYADDDISTETTPDISLTINGVNTSKAYVGGVAGQNNGSIANVKAEAIVEGADLTNVVAGGVVGVDSNGELFKISGSLVTASKIDCGGSVVGRANNDITLSDVKGVVRLNTTGSVGSEVAANAFSAKYAGGIIGVAYQNVTLNPGVYVVGFVTENNAVSKFSGEYAGGIVGKVGSINITEADAEVVSFEDVNVIGSTNGGVIAGEVGGKITLNSNSEDSFVFEAYYSNGDLAYELTTEAVGNTAVTDANGNPVYVFENGTRKQLYFDNARPVYDIADDYGIYATEVKFEGQLADFGYNVYYSNNEGHRGDKIAKAYAKLNLADGSYTLVTEDGDFALTIVPEFGDYNYSICSYVDGEQTTYVYVAEDQTIVATDVNNVVSVSQNVYGNYVANDANKTIVTSNKQHTYGGEAEGTVDGIVYEYDELINFNGNQVYTYEYISGESSIYADVKVTENSTVVMLNNTEVTTDSDNNVTSALYGSQIAASSTYAMQRNVARSVATFAAMVAPGNAEDVANVPEFNTPSGFENGHGVKSSYISTLGGSENGEIYAVDTTSANNMQAMYVLLNNVDSTTIFNLSGLINNLNYYKVSVDSFNNSAALYSNTLIVNGAGTIALTLTPYSSINSASYIMLIRIAKKPDATIYTKTLSGQIEKINNNSTIKLTSGSEFVFYADNVMNPEYAANGNGETADSISENANEFSVTLNGNSTQVTFSDSVNFAGETISVGGVSYTLDLFKIAYREWNFSVVKGYDLEFISATLSNAEITKNDEVYLTLKLKVYGYVENPDNIVSGLDFNNVVVGSTDAPIIANRILNSNAVTDSTANTTTITINVLYYISNRNVSINSGYTANLYVYASRDVYTKVDLRIVPQTIAYLGDTLTPLYGKQVYTEGSVVFDKVAAEVALTPAFFYNDVESINVSASVKIDGAPDTNYGTVIVSATGTTLNGKASLQVEKHKVSDDNYNKFVFYVYVSAIPSISSNLIEKSTLILNVTWGKNGESQTIRYSILQIPDLQFDTSVPYYAVASEKELIVVNSAHQKVDNLTTTAFYAFGIETINNADTGRVVPERPFNVAGETNASFGDFYVNGAEDVTYIARKTPTGAGLFVSTLPLGSDVTIGLYAKVDIGGGKKETLLISRFTVTVVEYTIESIEFSTPSGLQQLDQEIPIDFDVQINYSPERVSNERALIIKQSIVEQLKSYWTAGEASDATDRYVELWYKGRTASGQSGESILRSKYYYGVEGGTSKFIVIPKLTDDKTFGNGYRIWGTSVNTALTIEVRAYIVYKNGIPELQVYNNNDHADHVMLTSEFNFEFYKLSTEETPTAIYNADQFRSLLSGEASINEHFRLMANITLTNYDPIPANFASLDGNGYVIYLESFATNANDSGSISLGLFSSIGANTLVKNLSVAVGELKTFGSTGSVLNLENYNSVAIGLITPENHGYIANCEVVNFDLTRKQAVNTTIKVSTAYGADVVVGGLVANNYGSIVNSRVGRSLNSDYKYLGYFTKSVNGQTTLDSTFKIADEETIKENGINISASGTIGGLVGYNHKTDDETGIISSSYFAAGTITNTASVVETSYTGGLAAFNEGQIALSSVEGKFSANQIAATEKDLLVRQGAGISSNGNIGGFVYKNAGTISDCYSNVTLSTNARSAAFVYKTEEGIVDNCYAFSNSSSTTNNSPFVGLEPFESVYEGTITNSYYFTLSSADVSADASGDENLDNTDLITKIPDASTARTDTTYTSFAFSQVSYNERGEQVESENGVWKFTEEFGPILTSANAISVSKYVPKRQELNDVAALQFNGEKEGDIFDTSLLGSIRDNDYMAVSSNNVVGAENIELNKYVFIRNAAEFNERILNGENEYQSKLASGKASKKVYRLISNITFGASGNSGATIATSTLQFEGILDGNGLNIYNLEITDKTISDTTATIKSLKSNKYVPSSLAAGMFGAMADGATVKNLNIYINEVASSNAEIVGGVVGILENSYVYNIKVLPDVSTTKNNRISGLYVSAGAVGMVLGDATSFKIANVSSNVSVIAAKDSKPLSASRYNNDPVNQIYGGFGSASTSSKGKTLYDVYNQELHYNGLSIAAGVIGVTDVTTTNNDATNNFVKQIANGQGNNVRLAQISRISAGGSELKATAINAAGVIGIIDENVFAHDIELVVSAYEGVETTPNIIGSLTLGGISVINSGLVKNARIVHENQFALDRKYLNAEGEYQFTQNSTRSLFALSRTGVADEFNIFVGGINAINNVGEIVDSYVKVDVTPTMDELPPQNGYIGLASGLSIGGRISYFYSLAAVDGSNFNAGLIGYAVKNTNVKADNVYDFNVNADANAFREYQQEISKHSVKDIPYVVINTANIIVPADASLANTQYAKFYAIAGYAEADNETDDGTSNVFGSQADFVINDTKTGYVTTLKNINFTNFKSTVSADGGVVTDYLVGGASKPKYYMQFGQSSSDEFYQLNSYYEGTNLAYGKHGGGADYQTIVAARASTTFKQFLSTLRWNIFTTERMPFPFYGISQNLIYIKTASDFDKLYLYPGNVFVILPNNTYGSDYAIDVSGAQLRRSSSVQFYGILTGRETANGQYPTIRVTLDDNANSLVNSTLDASIYNFNIEVSTSGTSAMAYGLFGSKATNTLFENINVYVNNNLAVNVNGSSGSGNAGVLVGELSSGSIVRNVNVEGAADEDGKAITTINVSGNNGSFGVIAGKIDASSASFSNKYGVSNLIISAADNSLVNAGGAFGSSVGSIISGLEINNVSITAKGANVGGAIGYAETSTLSAVALNAIKLEGKVAGGVVGHAKGATIRNSYAKAGINNMDSVKGADYAGGFAGILEDNGEGTNSTINYCFSSLNVVGSGANVTAGGFVGYTTAQISNSYATGDVTTGVKYAGGFAGRIVGGSIYTCYSTGKVDASTTAGGFASSAEGAFTIQNSFTLSKLVGTVASGKNFKNFVAVVAAADDATITNCYYASELNYKTILANTNNTYKIVDDEFYAGEDESGEATGVYARSLSKFFNSTFRIQGFEKSTLTENNVQYALSFNIPVGTGTPSEFANVQQNNKMLKALIVGDGENSIKNVMGKSEIFLVRAHSTGSTNGTLAETLKGKIVIGEDISGSSTAYHLEVASNTPLFKNVENSIIANLKVFANGANADSVIAQTVKNSVLNKVVVDGSLNASVGTFTGVGAIAGQLTSSSLLINSHNAANVSSESDYVGGLVGVLDGNSAIISSYNSGDINAKECFVIGGLVGRAYTSSIYKCYNTGKVSGKKWVAGLVGYAGGASNSDATTIEVNSVYNTGLVSGVEEMAGLVYANPSSNTTLILANAYNSGAINNYTGRSYLVNGAETYYPVANKGVGERCYYNSDLFPEVIVKSPIVAKGTPLTTTQLTELTAYGLNSNFEAITNRSANTYAFPLLKNVGGYSKTEDGAQARGYGANLNVVNTYADLIVDGSEYHSKANSIVVADFDATGIADFKGDFTGTIYGCNHTIYNLTKSLIVSGQNATICNLRLVGTNITNPNANELDNRSNAGDMGSAVALDFNNGFISNVIFTGELNVHIVLGTTTAYAGGIAGKTENSTILYCNVIETDIYQYFGDGSGEATTAYIGGVVGRAENSYVNKNTYSGNIYLARGFFENSVGFVNVNSFNIGGIVGYKVGDTKITNNIVQNQVYYATHVDTNGLAADVELSAGENKTLSSNNGTSITTANVNVYNVANLSATDTGNDNSRSTALQNGNAYANINNMNVDTTTKLGLSNVMRPITSLIASVMSSNVDWGSTYKLSQLIYNAEGFRNIVGGRYYKLVCNVDGVGEFYSDTSPRYFDGRGYVVSDVTSANGAMFGTIDTFVDNTLARDQILKSTIKNVVLNNARVSDVVSSSTNSAVLAKVNKGVVKYVGIIKSTLDVANTSGDGGVQSSAYYSTTANYEPGFGTYYAGNVGGLVGYNNGGSVVYSYSMAQISISGATSGAVGGLVGRNYNGSVAYSYGSGLISFPYNATTGLNTFSSSGAVGASQNGTLTNVYANSDIMIATEEKNSSVTRKAANEISLSMFKQVSGFAQNGITTVKNAGMPILNRHKNFNTYLPYAFNWKANLDAVSGTAINSLDSISDKSTSSYYLTNNVVLTSALDASKFQSFGGKLFFNGYSIIGYNWSSTINSSSNAKVGLFSSLCRSDNKGSDVYDASFVNPRVKVNVTTNSIMSSYSTYWSATTQLYVGVLAANSCHGRVYNANILGGFTSVICKDFDSNDGTSTLNATSSKNVKLPTINVDAVNPGNKTNVKQTGYAYTSSIYVRAAGAKTQDLYPTGSTLYNAMTEAEFKKLLPSRTTLTNYNYSWGIFKDGQITKGMTTGYIELSQINLSKVNSASNVVEIAEGYAKTGSTQSYSLSGSSRWSGSSVWSNLENVLNKVRQGHTLGTEKTGYINGVKVSDTNSKILYAYNAYTSTGSTYGQNRTYSVSFSWSKKSGDAVEKSSSAQYTITNRDTFQVEGKYVSSLGGFEK